MANKAQTVVIRGKTSFARVLKHQLSPNFAKDGKEWKLDLVIDKNTEKELKNYGIANKVKKKDNYLDGQPYLSFKQSEFKNDGEPNFPIKVTDIKGEAWDQDKELGNGTDVDVKFVVIEYPGKPSGTYLRSIRVLKLVPYDREEFPALTEDDEFFAEAAKQAANEDAEFRKDFGLSEDLDDEIPM